MPGLTFRETMRGPFALDVAEPRKGAVRGQLADSWLRMHAVVSIPDVTAFVRDPEHAGALAGRIDFPPLGTGVRSTNGVFRLFAPASSASGPAARVMDYELAFTIGGEHWFLAGSKLVTGRRLLDVWPETTTLYARLHLGDDRSGPIAGAGVLHLGVGQLAAMLATFRASGDPDVAVSRGAREIARFGRFFAGELWTIYAGRRA